MGRARTRTLDDNTSASHPGGVQVCHAKLRLLRPDLYGLRRVWRWMTGRETGRWEKTYIREQLRHGDSRAAVVISTVPLLVAAYTDELDCVALLRFPDELARANDLFAGSRLLTVNTYKSPEHQPDYDADLILGPAMIKRWTGFHPIIAEFVSDDREQIEARKRAISEDEWKRTLSLGQAYRASRPGLARDGRPIYAWLPAKLGR